MAKIFLFSRGTRRHVASWDRGRLVSHGVIDPGSPDRAGAVYLARVRRVDRSLGAAFVEFCPGEDGLLPLSGKRELTEGSALLVQMRREKQGAKAARLSDGIVLVERDLWLRIGRAGVEVYPQLRPSPRLEEARAAVAAILPPGQGALLRPSIETATSDDVKHQLDHLLETWRSLARLAANKKPPSLLRPADDALDQVLRDLTEDTQVDIICADRTTAQLVARRAIDQGRGALRTSILPESRWIPSPQELQEALDDALADRVELPGGGWLLFEPGQTLVAIDVNAGDVSARGGMDTSSDRRRRSLNQAATEEIAAQIRLRNLGGPIVIDFISMRTRSDQAAVVDSLRAACCADPRPCDILAMSRFGLVEMVRQSSGLTLAEQLRSER